MATQAVAFTHVENNYVEKSTFDLSHFHITTTKHGELLPVFTHEVMPGDTFKLKTNLLARYMPLVNPPMSPLKVQIHYFYVKNRLLMKNWENFYLQRKENGNEVSIPTIPATFFENEGYKRLLDRMGFPTKKYTIVSGEPTISDITEYPDATFSALPLMAFYKCWVDYFVDQNLDPAFEEYMEKNYDDGITSSQVQDFFDTLTENGTATRKYRAWDHDYFTSMLPWPQRGNAVLLPLEFQGQSPLEWGIETLLGGQQFLGTNGEPITSGSAFTTHATEGRLRIDGENAYVDISEAFTNLSNLDASVTSTINDLRESIRLQKYLETAARVGMRYAERIANEFNIDSDRIDDHRAVYLGDFTQMVQISEVPQTSQTTTGTDGSPQGNLAANAQIHGSDHSFKYNFPEHGYVIGIASITTDSMYSQGIPKMFARNAQDDFYHPQFEGIGEQPVYELEMLYHPYTSPEGGEDNMRVIGFLPYASDFRTILSRYTGETRDYFLNWHLGRIFNTDSQVLLNKDLVYTEHDDFSRIFAVTGEDEPDQVLLHLHFDLKATRPISVFGTPADL